MSGVPGDFSYKVGSFQVYVPQFLSDTVVIRPYGEYGMATSGYWTNLGGVYGVNTQSYQTDPNSSPMTDLVYLVKNDLKLLPTVTRVLIAVYWYTSDDVSLGTWTYTVGPAIGPEVQAWNWSNAPPMWQVGTWSRSNAYWLTNNHQVWPTPEDTTLIQGMQYLQSQGYEVGVLPIAAAISRDYFFPAGGDWEVDRYQLVWNDSTKLASYLTSYTAFIHHYIDLCASNNFRPWLFSIGSGMRDLMTVPNRPGDFIKVITMFQNLAYYCKQTLPNTQTIYFADLDEYFYPYPLFNYPCYLDPLWTTPELDFIGVNWFAPLALDDSEDVAALITGTLQGEGYSFYLPNVLWRGSPWSDRFISITSNNFKTGAAQSPLNPRVNGVKDIADWLVFNHYYPRVSAHMAGCTPPVMIVPGDPRAGMNINGNGTMVSVQAPLAPDAGGIAPAPILHDCYAELDPDTYCFFSFPTTIPDNSQLDFEIDFALNALTSSATANYRVIATAFGLMIDITEGTVTVQLPQSNGSFQSIGLFTLWTGDIELIYTANQVQIFVNGAADQTILPATGLSFVLPTFSETCWLGNPPPPYQVPSGYSPWNGRIYYIKTIFGTGNNLSGGEYFFEDSYNGIRTAWEPATSKEWIAITGYGSIHGSGADPLTRPTTIQYSGAAQITSSYPDAVALNNAVFWNNWHLWNIQGPYGSDYDPDEIYQAYMLYSATVGLEPAGPVHIATWFMDTRSPSARLVIMPGTGWQIYNDAYDGEIDCSINGKATVRSGGVNMLDVPMQTIDERLGLSITPGPLSPERSILVEPGVPQQ